MAFWTRITSLIAGGAVARASADAATPVLEPVRQHAWSRNRLRVLDPESAARLLVQAIIDEKEATEEAGRSGFNENRLHALMLLAQVAPGLADARSLRRRDKIKVDDLHHVYAKSQIEPQYWDELDGLVDVLLSPAEVAAAVQQGHLPNTSKIEGGDPILPTVGTSVPAVGGQVTAEAPDGGDPSHVPLTQINLDPFEQARGSGTSFEQLKVLANLSGLPPGAELLLSMWNRELIDEESVDAGIREGHMKTKWAQAFKRLRWNVLGAAEYAGLHLRGWIDEEAMYKGGKLTGHTKEQMDLLYLNHGRPMAPGQAFTASFRPAPSPYRTKPDGTPEQFGYPDFKRSIEQSDIRTEYVDPLWATRHAYPPLFQLGRLAEAGALQRDRVETILGYERYEKEDIKALADFWYGAGATSKSADPHIGKARTQLWSQTHSSYVKGEIGAADARTALPTAGVDAASVDGVLATWDEERALVRKQLSVAQIKKAVADAVVNVATGLAWTVADAVAALVDRGYSQADAQTIMAEA